MGGVLHGLEHDVGYPHVGAVVQQFVLVMGQFAFAGRLGGVLDLPVFHRLNGDDQVGPVAWFQLGVADVPRLQEGQDLGFVGAAVASLVPSIIVTGKQIGRAHV